MPGVGVFVELTEDPCWASLEELSGGGGEPFGTGWQVAADGCAPSTGGGRRTLAASVSPECSLNTQAYPPAIAVTRCVSTTVLPDDVMETAIVVVVDCVKLVNEAIVSNAYVPTTVAVTVVSGTDPGGQA